MPGWIFNKIAQLREGMQLRFPRIPILWLAIAVVKNVKLVNIVVATQQAKNTQSCEAVMTCATQNVIWLATKKCGIQYVGETSQAIRSRMNNYRHKLNQMWPFFVSTFLFKWPQQIWHNYCAHRGRVVQGCCGDSTVFLECPSYCSYCIGKPSYGIEPCRSVQWVYAVYTMMKHREDDSLYIHNYFLYIST